MKTLTCPLRAKRLLFQVKHKNNYESCFIFGGVSAATVRSLKSRFVMDTWYVELFYLEAGFGLEGRGFNLCCGTLFFPPHFPPPLSFFSLPLSFFLPSFPFFLLPFPFFSPLFFFLPSFPPFRYPLHVHSATSMLKHFSSY